MCCISKPQDKTNRRQFVKLSSLSQGSRTVSMANNLPVAGDLLKGLESNSDGEEQLIVDEVNSAPAARSRGAAKSRPPALKVKLSGLINLFLFLTE